jgi:hypothetical protein
MPEEPTSAGSPPPAESFERRIERLEQENRWWRGSLIAVLAFVALMLLAGHHRRARIDVVVTVPPWALRMPYWGYGPGAYPQPPRACGDVPPGEGVAPGRGPRPEAPRSPPSSSDPWRPDEPLRVSHLGR